MKQHQQLINSLHMQRTQYIQALRHCGIFDLCDIMDFVSEKQNIM